MNSGDDWLSGPACQRAERQVNQCFTAGMRCIEQKDWPGAVRAFCGAIEAEPRCAEAYSNLGVVLKNMGQPDQAEAFLLKAVEVNPNCTHAFYTLGFLYQQRGGFADAETCFRRVIELEPQAARHYNNLGVLLEYRYRPEEAETCYRRAIALQPDSALAHYNLGNLLAAARQPAAGEACLQRARELAPENYKLDMALAFFKLSVGQFAAGWTMYRQAMDKNGTEFRVPGLRQWRGEDLSGCRLLLYAGKGFGDTLQFYRYANMAAELAADTVVYVQKPLQRLLAAAAASLTVCGEQEALCQSYDYACSLQALPIVFQTDETTIPCRRPYIHALPEAAAAWRSYLQPFSAKNLLTAGLVWAGNPKNPMDHFRSLPFERLQRLLTLPGVGWVSLQTGRRAEACRGQAMLDIADRLTDFSQTAGVMEQLDLVVTTDTAVAHLAGAMGKPTWVLLDTNCDWRWQLERTDCPWYPSVRLFRQRRAGDWAEVVERVAGALQQECADS